MPRIYQMDPKVTLAEAEANPGEYFCPVDYCRRCWNEAVADAGPEDELDADHPDYEETDYLCESCDRPLTARDNYV